MTFLFFTDKTLMIIALFFPWAIKKGEICKEWGLSLLVHSRLPHMQYQYNVRLCLWKVLDNLNLFFSTWKYCVTVYLKVKISKGPWIVIYRPCCHYSQLPRHRKHSIKFSRLAVWWWMQEEISVEKRMTSNLLFFQYGGLSFLLSEKAWAIIKLKNMLNYLTLFISHTPYSPTFSLFLMKHRSLQMERLILGLNFVLVFLLFTTALFWGC